MSRVTGVEEQDDALFKILEEVGVATSLLGLMDGERDYNHAFTHTTPQTSCSLGYCRNFLSLTLNAYQ
jgi:hypothetical protein